MGTELKWTSKNTAGSSPQLQVFLPSGGTEIRVATILMTQHRSRADFAKTRDSRMTHDKPHRSPINK
jgi:hypothetical protein